MDVCRPDLVDNLDMRPSISEFSYGFAVTTELLRVLGPVTVAPVFPSLRAEGKQGGGWDVRLDWPGFPLFLQFKLCDHMTRHTCKEARLLGSSLPCYRMHLRPTRLSPQHRLLLELEQQGREVYYCAPMFHDTEAFNDAFLQHSVCTRSIWIRPSDVGELPDNGDHHVSFEPGGRRWLFSKPTLIEAECMFQNFSAQLRSRLRERGKIDLSEEQLAHLADEIANIAARRGYVDNRDAHIWSEEGHEVAPQSAHPLQRVAYYASVFLDSQLFLVQERQDV